MKYFPSIVQVKFLYWIACVNGQYFCTPDRVWGCKYSQLYSCLIRHSCTNGPSDFIRTYRTSRTYSQCPLFLQATRLLQITRTLTKPYSSCFKDAQRQTLWDGGNASRVTWHFSSCAYHILWTKHSYTKIYERVTTEKTTLKKPYTRQMQVISRYRASISFCFFGEGGGKEGKSLVTLPCLVWAFLLLWTRNMMASRQLPA